MTSEHRPSQGPPMLVRFLILFLSCATISAADPADFVKLLEQAPLIDE